MSHQMNKEDASHIQAAEANKNDGKVAAGGFAARAQAAADGHANKGGHGDSGKQAEGQRK